MKRLNFKVNLLRNQLTADSGQIPKELSSLTENLQLLYDVPLSYLIPDPSFLPPESIRFFYIDENFIQAMINGATSIARNCTAEEEIDRAALPIVTACSKKRSVHMRRAKIHANHQQKLDCVYTENSEVRTGFLLRSSLVHRRKGIVIYAKKGDNTLPTLRLDLIAPDIMLGIFDGEPTHLTITEPKCGLRFGCQDNSLKNPVISLKDLGKPVENAYYSVPADTNGRIDVLAAAGQIQSVLKSKGELNTDVSPQIFAYELLLAAQKAEFLKKQENDL